jgi:hypothetical protein
MKSVRNKLKNVLVITILTGMSAFAQEKEGEKVPAAGDGKDPGLHQNEFKTYVIEREAPGAGDLTSEQLRDMSKVSNKAVGEIGTDIVWLHSYVTSDKIYCVYRTNDKKLLEKHAEKGGFPLDDIKELSTVIRPETAEN